MSNAKEVIVIGAGIIGASIAWHLAKAGAQVTVIADSGAGGVATPNSFAWINASWGNPEIYFRLRTRAMAEWTRLAKDLPGLPLAWCGSLCWDMPVDRLEALCRRAFVLGLWRRAHRPRTSGAHRTQSRRASRLRPPCRRGRRGRTGRDR